MTKEDPFQKETYLFLHFFRNLWNQKIRYHRSPWVLDDTIAGYVVVAFGLNRSAVRHVPIVLYLSLSRPAKLRERTGSFRSVVERVPCPDGAGRVLMARRGL
jgi:hypothetical protein